MGRRGFRTDEISERDVDLNAGLGSVEALEPEEDGEPDEVDETEDVSPSGEGVPADGTGTDAAQEEDTGDDADGGTPEPDYGPGRDTVYRRETWPKYAYPPRRKLRIPMAAVWAVAGVAAGLVLSSVIFMGIRAVQERMMYQNVEQVIRAQWPNMDLTIRPGFHDDMVNAPYYDSRSWRNMDPVENDDGSITFAASTSREFCDLILDMRTYMDRLMAEFEADETYLGFGAAAASLDYDVITVKTQMHQSGLIDQEKAVVLLRQMKIHNIFYRAISGEEPEVRLVFVNENDGETVLVMRM